jgi:hypothetical protein
MRKESMRFKRMLVHKHFFLEQDGFGYSQGVEDVDKTKKEEEKADLENEIVASLSGQSIYQLH